MNLIPLFDRVIIEQIKREPTTASSIVIPASVSDSHVARGKVVATPEIGKEYLPGGHIALADGKVREKVLSVGETVLFNFYTGAKVESEGREYFILRDSEILAIVRE